MSIDSSPRGQIILKELLVSSNSPQKTNSFLLLRQIRSFIFWKNSRTPESFRNYLMFTDCQKHMKIMAVKAAYSENLALPIHLIKITDQRQIDEKQMNELF